MTLRLKAQREKLRAEIETYKAKRDLGNRIEAFLADLWADGGEEAFLLGLSLIDERAPALYEKLAGK